MPTSRRRPASGQGGLEVAGRGKHVRSVIDGLFGRDERAHGPVHHRALGALGRREQAGHHATVRPNDAGELRLAPAAGRRRTGTGWTPTTASNAASPNGRPSMSPSRRSAAGSRSRARPTRPGLMSRPLGVAPRRGGQDEREPGSAAHVEQARALSDACGVEHRLEQVVRLGQVRPRAQVGPPQAALDLGRGADRRARHRPARVVCRTAGVQRGSSSAAPSPARRRGEAAIHPAMTSLCWCSSTG